MVLNNAENGKQNDFNQSSKGFRPVDQKILLDKMKCKGSMT